MKGHTTTTTTAAAAAYSRIYKYFTILVGGKAHMRACAPLRRIHTYLGMYEYRVFRREKKYRVGKLVVRYLVAVIHPR